MTTITMTLKLADLIPAGFVRFAPSKSKPNKAYELRMGADGNLYCTCPAWKFQKGKHPHTRTCKHLQEHAAAIVADAFLKKVAKAA